MNPKKKIAVRVELTNIYTDESIMVTLPQKNFSSCLPFHWDMIEIQKSILTTNIISEPAFEDNEFFDVLTLNEILLRYEILEDFEKDIIYNLFEMEEKRDLTHFLSVFNTYQNYDIIADSAADMETLANLVLLAIFDYENATIISETHKEFLPIETQSTLIHIGLRSKILQHHKGVWYAKFPPLAQAFNEGDEALLF